MRKQLFRLFSRLPFSVLYVLSDLIYGVLYYIVGYRKKVVRMNLKNSFPEKTHQELRQIEKGFYHFLCDYGVESLKLLTISPEDMKKHMVFENTEAINDALNDHNFVFVYIGHYCNWEWISSLPLWTREVATLGELYRPLKSKVMDELFMELRQHFNAECISKYDALRHIMRFKAENKNASLDLWPTKRHTPKTRTSGWISFRRTRPSSRALNVSARRWMPRYSLRTFTE